MRLCRSSKSSLRPRRAHCSGHAGCCWLRRCNNKGQAETPRGGVPYCSWCAESVVTRAPCKVAQFLEGPMPSAHIAWINSINQRSCRMLQCIMTCQLELPTWETSYPWSTSTHHNTLPCMHACIMMHHGYHVCPFGVTNLDGVDANVNQLCRKSTKPVQTGPGVQAVQTEQMSKPHQQQRKRRASSAPQCGEYMHGHAHYMLVMPLSCSWQQR